MNTSHLHGRELREHAEAASQLLRTISNPARLTILCALVEDEHSVGELSGLISLSMSAVSQHLAVLRREGIVETRRDGQTIHYSLADHDVRAVMACLHGIYCE